MLLPPLETVTDCLLQLAAELAHKGLNTLLMPYNDRFRLHQKLENVVLNARAAATYAPFQELESKQLLFDLLHNAGGAGTECHHFFERTTASTIFTLFYGIRIKTLDEPALRVAAALYFGVPGYSPGNDDSACDSWLSYRVRCLRR